jgi:xanthine dehydrogenase YagR molybdenum-binding subunit
MPNESVVDKAKETVGLGQTPVTQAAKSDRPLDLERAFDALGVSVVEEYGEWKPDGAPMIHSARCTRVRCAWSAATR